jgi:hypothetical protein
LLSFIICSCGRIAFFLAGGHLPRCENEQTIRGYLGKEKIKTDNVYVIADSSAWDFLMMKFANLPEICYFDRNGYHILLRDSAQCNGQNYTLLAALDTIKNYRVDSTFTFPMLMSKLKILDGNGADTVPAGRPDYYLAISWAIFANPAIYKVRDWDHMLDTLNTGLKLKAVKVNFDIMESWGCVAGEKITIGKYRM